MNDENAETVVEDENVPDETVADEPQDQRKEFVHDPEVHGRDYRVEGNDVRDYIGVDPEYRTYANEYDAPMLTDTERFNFTDQYDHLEGNHDEADDTYELTESQRKILRDAGEPVEGDEGDVVVEDSEAKGESDETVTPAERPSETPLFTTP